MFIQYFGILIAVFLDSGTFYNFISTPLLDAISINHMKCWMQPMKIYLDNKAGAHSSQITDLPLVLTNHT